MEECLFCNIVLKKISAKIIYESEQLLAFNDIQPQAPIHILIIPKIHIPTLNNIEEKHKNLMGELILAASILAKKFNIDGDGYRTNFNCNANGGQTVYHIHLHLLGGRKFSWPPG
ncbi:MAG: histidine triad nucleotide-binding protein [Candidatus Neomarinimicrobiota bacterium]